MTWWALTMIMLFVFFRYDVWRNWFSENLLCFSNSLLGKHTDGEWGRCWGIESGEFMSFAFMPLFHPTERLSMLLLCDDKEQIRLIAKMLRGETFQSVGKLCAAKNLFPFETSNQHKYHIKASDNETLISILFKAIIINHPHGWATQSIPSLISTKEKSPQKKKRRKSIDIQQNPYKCKLLIWHRHNLHRFEEIFKALNHSNSTKKCLLFEYRKTVSPRQHFPIPQQTEEPSEFAYRLDFHGKLITNLLVIFPNEK